MFQKWSLYYPIYRQHELEFRLFFPLLSQYPSTQTMRVTILQHHYYSLLSEHKFHIVGEHPAPFTEGIIALPILQTSKEFELVLDPLMGSGTVGRVCDKFERSFVGYDFKSFSCLFMV